MHSNLIYSFSFIFENYLCRIWFNYKWYKKKLRTKLFDNTYFFSNNYGDSMHKFYTESFNTFSLKHFTFFSGDFKTWFWSRSTLAKKHVKKKTFVQKWQIIAAASSIVGLCPLCELLDRRLCPLSELLYHQLCLICELLQWQIL